MDRIPPRQSGNRWFPAARVLLSSDFGLFVAVGAERISYAFRKNPYSTKLRLLGGISTDGKVEFRADHDLRFENSKSHLESRALLSQLTQTRFYGFGNDTERLGDASSDFFRLRAVVEPLEVEQRRRLGAHHIGKLAHAKGLEQAARAPPVSSSENGTLSDG